MCAMEFSVLIWCHIVWIIVFLNEEKDIVDSALTFDSFKLIVVVF